MRSEGFASNHIVKLYFCLQENELKVDIGEGNTLGQMSPKLLAKVKLNFDHNTIKTKDSRKFLTYVARQTMWFDLVTKILYV